MTVTVYLCPAVPDAPGETAAETTSEDTRTESEGGQSSTDVSFDSFVHWHLVDGVMHERAVGGACEFCEEDDA